MGDNWQVQLLWSILISVTQLLAVGFGYLYYKDRDKRKLMFALAFPLAGVAYIPNALPGWTSVPMAEKIYEWAFLPISSAVFVALLCSLFKLKDFDKPFKAFLLVLTSSVIMLFVPVSATPTPFLWFEAIGSTVVSVYIILIRKQIPELMFLLSIACSVLAGVGRTLDLASEFNIFGYLMAYVFIALVFVIPNEISEESVGSIFALEKELKTEKGKFERLFMQLPEAAVYVDSDFHILNVNPRFCELFGYSQEEVKGKNIDNVVAPEQKKDEARILTENAVKEAVYCDTVRQKKNGRMFNVSLSVAPIVVEGHHIGAVALYRDITKRRKMEEQLETYSSQLEKLVDQRTQELKQSDEKLQRIVDGSPIPAFFIGTDHKIVYWNKAIEKLSALKAEEMIGTDQHWKAFYQEKRPCLADLLLDGRAIQIPSWYSGDCKESELVEGGYEVTKFFSLLGKEGEWLHFTAVAIKNHEGKVVGAFETLENVTELKETQQRLLRSERLAAIGELAGMVGHDLRNPLQAIRNSAACLKLLLDSNRSHEIEDVLRAVDQSIEYSNNIVTDLLDYSREVRLELTRTTPKLMLEKTLSMVEFPQNIQLLNTVEDDSEINVDVDKMTRVFINITKNAIEAMPKGGTLTITSERPNKDLKIAFTDSGTGMTKEDMEKLWTPLHTTRAKGIGFGLPICKRVVDAHGGCIDVRSKIDHGTTFTVILPLKTEVTRPLTSP
jgi:PAS domain S-box-containing protein